METNDILVETIHSLLCDKKHSSTMEDMVKGRNPDECYYYMEQNLAEQWELPDHKYWSSQANEIKNNLKASNAEEALRSIYKVLDLIEKVNQFSNAEYDFFIHLLPSDEDL